MENQKNNYVVSNYRDRLLHNIEDYGLKKLYEELRIYRGEDVSSTVPEADEKKRWRNFKNSIDFIKDGNGLLNNAEDLVFVLDRIGLDFHELLTNKEGKYKERVDEQNRRIESILLGINNKLPEEKKVSKRQKRKVNTKSLNSAVDIYKNIFYIVTNYIEKYLCSESEISNWMYAPYNDFKRLYLYLFKNESLRRKLKKDEYQFVLDSIALFETKNESLITWYSFDSPKHFEIYSSNTISNLSPTLTDFESINIMIVLISFYIMAIHNFYSTIKNHKGFDDEIIQSNIDSINILINKQKILIKKIQRCNKADGYEIIESRTRILTISLLGLQQESYVTENRFEYNDFINSFLSWIVMLDSTITDLKLKLYKKELLVSINEIYDDLIEKAGEQSIALIEPRGKGFATAVIAKETLNNEISLTNLINSSPEEVYSKINQLRSQM